MALSAGVRRLKLVGEVSKQIENELIEEEEVNAIIKIKMKKIAEK